LAAQQDFIDAGSCIEGGLRPGVKLAAGLPGAPAVLQPMQAHLGFLPFRFRKDEGS
jgi:hypothetical protein